MIKEIKKNRLYSKLLNYLNSLDLMDGGDDKKFFYVDGMTYIYRINIETNDITFNKFQLKTKSGIDLFEDEYLKIIKIKHNIK